MRSLNLLHRLRRDERGQTLIEYALIAVLVSIAAIVLMAAIGFDLQEWIDPIEEALGIDEGEAPVPAGDEDAEPGAGA